MKSLTRAAAAALLYLLAGVLFLGTTGALFVFAMTEPIR